MAEDENGARFRRQMPMTRSLRGFDVNMLVRDVGRSVGYLAEVLGIRTVHKDRDFAVCATTVRNGCCTPTPAIAATPCSR